MAFDPNNPTFYGSCLQVDFARVITGVERHTGPGETGDALRYLYNDTDHAWFEPGDRALIGFYPEPGLLTPADAVEFHLVVELRGDSTGTLRLSAGVDPNFELTDPTLASEPLGTFSANGVSQIVVPVSSWTGAMIYGGQVEPFILLEALDGLPRIMQTRVRMWPVGGVTGTWESDPDYVIEDVEPRFLVSDGAASISGGSNEPQSLGSPGPRSSNAGPGTWGGFDDMGDTGAAFQEMVGFLTAHGIPAYQSFQSLRTVGGGLIRGTFDFMWTLQRVSTEPPTHDWTGSFGSGMVLILADPVAATGRQNGPIYADPDRVPGEDAAMVRNGRTGGTLDSVFVSWATQPQLLPTGGRNGDYIGVRTFALGSDTWDATESVGSVDYYFTENGLEAAAGPRPDPPDTTVVPLPDIPLVGIEVNGTCAPPFDSLEFGQGASLVAVASGARTVDFNGVRAIHRYEDVQWYNPGGVAKPSRKPRFYVTYTEVDEHPVDVSHVVGIGKPADDLSIFRVPTPLGTLRELRHGEAVSDVSVAYPLKVKLEDGSWTVVAGMTPDD